MQILLSSTNLAKTTATQEFFNSQNIDFELHTVDVDSGVAKTPDSDDEGISGCINRINESKKQAKADLYVGMEGIITKNTFGTFLCGWVCLETADGKRYFGCSAKCQLPDEIAQNVSSFGELSTLVKNTYPTELTQQMDKIGTNGVITNSLYTRVDEFEDALKCAWGLMSFGG